MNYEKDKFESLNLQSHSIQIRRKVIKLLALQITTKPVYTSSKKPMVEANVTAVAAKKSENLDPELAMREMCDRHGEFKLEEKDGIKAGVLKF